ncbi:MAG: hypothetical protein ABI947_16160 [Chloroflexota bacterium]
MTIHSSESQVPQGYSPRAEIDQALNATRAVIEEAIGYIERQEDGPLTMRFALRDIEDQVNALETEAIYAHRRTKQDCAAFTASARRRDPAIQVDHWAIWLARLSRGSTVKQLTLSVGC